MNCPKCMGTNVTIQMVSKTKTKGKGCLYWLIIGWWLQPMLWLFFTLPMLIIAIFRPKKVGTKVEKQAVCQSCGNSWKVKI